MATYKQLDAHTIGIIIADYAMTGSYTVVGKKYGISKDRVKRIVDEHAETRRITLALKKEVTYDVNNYIKSIQPAVKELIALYLKELFTPEKIAKASPKDLAIVMGILTEKFGVSTDDAVKSTHTALDGLIDKLKDKKPNE